MVLHLMVPYHLFPDNWCNSLSPTKYMLLQRTYITGTLRSDRTYIPVKVMKKKLKKGEMILKSLNDISHDKMIKWKEKRGVSMITNTFVPELVQSVNIHGNSKQKLNTIHVYNQNMSGIDWSDQMLSYYSGLRKTVRWHKKVRIHICETFMANSFYFYMKNTTRSKFSTMKEYKEAIVQVLVGPVKPSTKAKPQLSLFMCYIHWEKEDTNKNMQTLLNKRK